MNAQSTSRKPLRLWPGVALVALLVLFKYVAVPILAIGSPPVALVGGMVAGGVILLWWLLFSRAPWAERLGAIGLIAVGLFATQRIVHQSIGEAGQGKFLPVLALPFVSVALVAWAAASRRLSSGPRRASMAATLLLACGSFALLRIGGLSGDGEMDLQWRWSKSKEERLLAQGDEPVSLPPPAPSAAPLTVPSKAPSAVPSAVPSALPPPPAPAQAQPPAASPAPAETAAEWPGFRGPGRDGIVHGVSIATDWSASPPVQMWRRPIGPGWSSFAVRGDLLYTQEQRGEDEIVACHRVSTGKPVWRHRDAARFWEAVGGAGPRGTPTLDRGRVYTFGATGVLNALDARTGALVWTRNAASDTNTKNPGWGFSSSPLVVGDTVIVAAAGNLAAYDAATGAPRWYGPRRRSCYSSPHLATIGGVAQVLLLNGTGATSVAPADGAVLWEHALAPGARIVQPALTADGDVLVANGEFGDGNSMRRLAVARGTGGWAVQERWTSGGLKPNYNDFVVHKGHAYGFDGAILACIDLADGSRKWKGGRYGNGQLVLLADQDLLLVVSEEGELALVNATPDAFTERARFKAIEGKTWNHPVLVRDVLLVRNGEEMAAFRLAPAGGTAKIAGGAPQ